MLFRYPVTALHVYYVVYVADSEHGRDNSALLLFTRTRNIPDKKVNQISIPRKDVSSEQAKTSTIRTFGLGLRQCLRVLFAETLLLFVVL